jgi:hypothetical protein
MAAGINANLLFKWRRDHLRLMRAPSTGAEALVPVLLTFIDSFAYCIGRVPASSSVIKTALDCNAIFSFALLAGMTARYRIAGRVTRMTFDEMLADHAALSGDMQRSQEAMKIALLTIEKIKVELTYLRRMKYDRFSGRIQRVDATH